MLEKTNQGIDNQPIQFHRVYIHNNYTFHSLHLWIVRSNYEGTFAEILNHMKKVVATMHRGLNSLFWGHQIMILCIWWFKPFFAQYALCNAAYMNPREMKFWNIWNREVNKHDIYVKSFISTLLKIACSQKSWDGWRSIFNK